MSMELSSRERYLTTFCQQEPDRVPVDLSTDEGFRYPGEPWRRKPMDRVKAIEQLGGDPCLDIWLPEPAFHPDVKVRTGGCGVSDEGYPLLFAEYETPAGVLRQVVKQTEDWHSEREHQLMQLRNLGDGVREDWDVHLFDDWNGPRYLEPPVKTIEDVEKLQYILRIPDGDELRRWREEARTVKQWAQERDLLLRARRTFGAESGMWFMKFEDFLCATLEDKLLVEAMLRVVGQWQVKRVKLALEIGIDVLMHRGYYESTRYFSPENYEHFCRPIIEELGSMTHQAGVRFALQRSEGNTAQIALLKEMPIDILYDVEPGMGGEDLGRLKAGLGDMMTLWGGVDSTLVVNRGSKEDAETAIHEALRLCAPGGGFVITPVKWIEPGASFDKMKPVLDAVRKYGRY